MSKIRFGLIGSGWRAEFYIRIAKALPEMFDLAAVMIRGKEKGEAFSEKFGVKVVNTLDELVEKEPEFVVMAIKRGIVTENLITLFKRGIPVLTETPPGEDVEALESLVKSKISIFLLFMDITVQVLFVSSSEQDLRTAGFTENVTGLM